MKVRIALAVLCSACLSPPAFGTGTDPGTSTGGPTSGSGPGSGATAVTSEATPTSEPSSTTEGNEGSSTSEEGSSSSGGTVDPFVFREDAPEAYTQVDRMGLPLFNTVLNAVGDQNAYNLSNNLEDLANEWRNEFRGSIEVLHLGSELVVDASDANGLNDDLLSLLQSEVSGALTMQTAVCQSEFVLENFCINQVEAALPVHDIAGDALRVDMNAAFGFRLGNGRQLSDPVADQLLALALLNLETASLEIDSLSDLPMNPDENDDVFLTEFPYLAPAH